MIAAKEIPPDPTTEQIIDAALGEFTEFGFRRVNVGDVARRADIHRATVYRRFPTKEALVSAVAIAWAHRFFRDIAKAVAPLPAFEDRVVEAFTLSLQRMRNDPLVSRILGSDSDLVLPSLTTQGGRLIAMVSDFFASQFAIGPGDRARVRQAAEVAARLGLSFVLTPDSRVPLNSPKEIRAFARRYVVPLTRQD